MPTNQAFLVDCLADPVFAEGTGVHTGFVQERFGARLATCRVPQSRALAYAAFAAIALQMPASRAAGAIAPPPLAAGSGMITLAQGGTRWQAAARAIGGAWQLELRELPNELRNELRDESHDAEPASQPAGDPQRFTLCAPCWHDAQRTTLSAECDGMRESIVVALERETLHVFHAGSAWTLDCISARKSRFADSGSGSVTAPMTGRVLDVVVNEGDRVTAGDRLLALEAMKMEHTLVAPLTGVVVEVRVQAGGQADKGALLIRIGEGA
jgi:geranyl-CoA carboxylase alpha subunit